MTRQMPSKRLIVAAAAVVAVVIAAVVLYMVFRGAGTESYRSVMVYELEGSAVIERAQIGAIEAAENLYLESGDRVTVGEDSMLRLKLDDDKYVTAEADTVLVLTAAGDAQDSETRIELERGAVTNEIQNPLSAQSVYETVTPNAVMAVRGTIYRAELGEDEEGNQVTRVCCFEGAVELASVSGAESYRPVLVEAGNEASVVGIDVPVSEVTPIAYDSLPPQTIELLREMHIDTGIESNEAPDAGEVQNDNDSSAQEDTAGQVQVSSGQRDESAVAQNRNRQAGDAKKDTGRRQSVTTAGAAADTAQPDQGAALQTGSEAAKKATDGSQTDASDGSPSYENGEQSGSDQSSQSDEGDQENRDDRDDQKPEGSSGHKPEAKPEVPGVKEYTVTFLYDGAVFATQRVKEGQMATAPTLLPEQSGSWNYDFTQPVTGDVTVEWNH